MYERDVCGMPDKGESENGNEAFEISVDWPDGHICVAGAGGYHSGHHSGVITGVGAYFVTLYSDLEYEYLYLDKELVIDKVLAKSKRKRVATYQVERMEILAPFHSYHLDNYKNRQVKIRDYSIGEELKPDLRYAAYYEGGEKLILSPSEELVKAIRNVAPRKVFMD